VYTVEEVDLLRLEKHIRVWKVDLEESRGGNRKLEVLLAQRLMRESALLMRTLRAYAGAKVSATGDRVKPVIQRGQVTPFLSVKGPTVPLEKKRRGDDRKTGEGFWAGA
jgi:hypothetical protein